MRPAGEYETRGTVVLGITKTMGENQSLGMPLHACVRVHVHVRMLM